MIYYNQVKGSKRKQKTGCTPTKVSNLSNPQDKFSLTIDIFYYIHFFRKVNEKSQKRKIANLITTALRCNLITR